MKLIIEIDAKTYNDIKVGKIYSSLRDVPLESANAIKNGIPIDDVKAEIKKNILDEPVENGTNAEMACYNGGLLKCLEIIDKHIGNAESKDPNDLTHMFDGVTEIPKDAFKGWTTEKLLEQIRKENNDNPEDIGCDHND